MRNKVELLISIKILVFMCTQSSSKRTPNELDSVLAKLVYESGMETFEYDDLALLSVVEQNIQMNHMQAEVVRY